MSSITLTAQAVSRTAIARGLFLLVGIAAQAAAIALLGPWSLALWLVPDLAMLPGVTSGAARDGRLAPRAVPFYNAAHTLAGPLALVAVGALAGPVALGLGLVWLSHVTVDRAAGYGLRNADGSRRG